MPLGSYGEVDDPFMICSDILHYTRADTEQLGSRQRLDCTFLTGTDHPKLYIHTQYEAKTSYTECIHSGIEFVIPNTRPRLPEALSHVPGPR